MHYQRIENALQICSDHLSGLDSMDLKNKELETYIVSGLVVLIVSEYEEYLEGIFGIRAKKCGDLHVENFIRQALSRNFRSPDLGKINEQLKRFDNSCKVAFMRQVENSQHHAAWDSIMKARHAIVHKQGDLKLTFGELLKNYALTKVVINEVEAALGLTDLK